MTKGLFNKRIPTLAALLVLAIIVGVSTILIQSGIFYIGKAAPDSQPLNFAITNITDTSFTAVFTTNGQVEGVVSMNDAKTGNTLILDDRDKKTGTPNKYYSHHITIPNLSANTSYTFRLIVGGNEYTNPLYTAKTGSSISTPPPAQNPLFGKVLLPDSSVGNDTIVIAKNPESNHVSAVTDTKGEFIIPTNSLRNAQLTAYLALTNDSSFALNFFRQTQTASATTTFLVAQNLPPVTLLQQYSFKETVQSKEGGVSQLSYGFPEQSGSTVTIRKPEQGEEFIDQRPIFSGTSFPNSSVDVLIPGVAQQQVLARADGLWTFQSQNNIPQGNHTITISVNDANNQKITQARRFTIFPLGSQVAESATPSATPTFRPTATPTRQQPTPTPTAVLSPTPSSAVSPTTQLTLSPSPTLLPTIYFTPTNTPTIGAPGAFENAVALTGVSVVLIIAGLALLFAL